MALAAVAMVLTSSVAWAQTSVVNAQDFAATAASSDMLEIQSSKLALQKAQASAVKDFAQMMIADHTDASKKLSAAAQQDGVAVSAEMMSRHAAKVGALSDLTGPAFDQRYVEMQLEAHREALGLMTGYAANGEAAALKAHAQATAPIIQMHLDHVQQLSSSK